MVIGSIMEEENSKEHNEIAIKKILSGLPNPINVKVEKCLSAKKLWEKPQDLHSKGLLVISYGPKYDEKEKK